MATRFYELAVGARFSFHGQEFRKSAMSMGVDSQGWGNVFMGHTVIEPVGELLLLPPDEAARWRPNYGCWAALIDSLDTGCGQEGTANSWVYSFPDRRVSALTQP